MTGIHPVHRGTRGDARSVAATLDEAFDNDRVSQWLMGEQLRRRQLGFFLVHVEHALAQQELGRGEVQLAFDDQGFAGAALWLSMDPLRPTAEPDTARLADALGPDAYERYQVLERVMHQHHPVGVAYAYLPFIGVTPARQGEGIGSQLLRTYLALLNDAGTPAFLIASSRRAVDGVYTRLGFRPHGQEFTLRDGPTMYPMLWEPQPARWPVNDGRFGNWPS